MFLAAERGIPHDPDRHAAYVGNWITALQNDKNEIFRAAHDASAATDYLLALERGQGRRKRSGRKARQQAASNTPPQRRPPTPSG